MKLTVESTKTNAGTRVLPMSDGVLEMFKSIIANRKPQNNEQVVEGYSGFLYLDKAGLPLVAMHWQHRMDHMVKRYNDIYKEQMPNITPHVCRHTYCSNMSKDSAVSHGAFGYRRHLEHLYPPGITGCKR